MAEPEQPYRAIRLIATVAGGLFLLAGLTS